MTIRAFILGLIGIVIICGGTYFNDMVLINTYTINGQLPTLVYGTLIIFLVFLRPILKRTASWFALSRKEITVILIMTIASCAVPAGYLMRQLPGVMINPLQIVEGEPGWKNCDIMQYVPEGMLAEVGDQRETVVSGWLSGLGTSKDHINPAEVPWQAFGKPLAFWLPIVISLWIALIGLALVVHRQWSDHEHLPYPLMTFTKSLLPQKNGDQSEIFRNKLFWVAFVFVVLVHVYNFMNAMTILKPYLPGSFPLIFDFSAFAELSDIFRKGNGAWYMTYWAHIYFVALGIAYFLPKDVSFSLGIGPLVWIMIQGTLLTYGFTGADWQQGSWRHGIFRDGMFLMGAYAAMFTMIIYTGRNYFKIVFSKAVFIPQKYKSDSSSVWGARIFLVSFSAFVVYLYAFAKIDWPLGIAFGLICCAVYVVMSRLVAETGIFYISYLCTPLGLIWALFGTQALGPGTILVLGTLGLILLFDSRDALMPFIVNLLKLAEDSKIKISKAATIATFSVVLALAIAIPSTLYWMYDLGTPSNFWPNYQAALPYHQTVAAIEKLDAQGVLDQTLPTGNHTGLARFLHIKPNKAALTNFGIAFAVVIIVSFLRLRIPKWPIHPVMFLTFMVYGGRAFAFSFLLAWFIKSLVMKYGGIQIYQKLKPFMIGLIAGELLGAVIPIVVNLIYYYFNGETIAQWSIFPA